MQIPEEKTEPLEIPEIHKYSPKQRKQYLTIGTIAGILILAAMAFLIPTQMKASEINKSLDLGEQYLTVGKYEEAILAFDKVIAIDAKNVSAYEGKGGSYLGLDNYPEAEAQLETAKSINFTDNGKVMMADVYVNTKRKDQGLALVDEVVNNQPEATKTIILITDFYNQIAEYNKAIEILEKKIAATSDQQELKKLYDELIPTYVKAGKSETEIFALLEKAAAATGDQSYIQNKDSYVIKNPTFSLAPGEYQSEQSLGINKSNPANKVYFTLDGTAPTPASPEFITPISLKSGKTTIKMIEVNEKGFMSPIQEGTFTVSSAIDVFPRIVDGGSYSFEPNGTLINYVHTLANPTASSELPPQGNYTFYAAQGDDRSISTPWIEGKGDSGIGEYIEFTVDKSDNDAIYATSSHNENDEIEKPLRVTKIWISNGYNRSDDSFQRNGAAKILKVYIDGVHSYNFNLEKVRDKQEFSITPYTIDNSSVFRFEIADVYPGEGDGTYDTAISEFDFYNEVKR